MEVDERREPAETGSFMQRLFRLGRSAPSTAAAVDNKPEPARSSDNDDSDSEIVFNTRQYRPEGNSDPINTHEAERTHTAQTALHVPSKTRTDTPYYHNVRRSTPKQLSNLAEASHDLPPIDAVSPIENAEAAAHLFGEGEDDMSPELVRQQRVTFGGVYEHERPVTPTGRYAKKAASAGYQPPVQLYDQYGTPVRVTSHGVEPMTHDSYGSTMSMPSRSSTSSTDGKFDVSSGYDAAAVRAGHRNVAVAHYRSATKTNVGKHLPMTGKRHTCLNFDILMGKIGKHINYTFCHVRFQTGGVMTKQPPF